MVRGDGALVWTRSSAVHRGCIGPILFCTHVQAAAMPVCEMASSLSSALWPPAPATHVPDFNHSTERRPPSSVGAVPCARCIPRNVSLRPADNCLPAPPPAQQSAGAAAAAGAAAGAARRITPARTAPAGPQASTRAALRGSEAARRRRPQPPTALGLCPAHPAS